MSSPRRRSRPARAPLRLLGFVAWRSLAESPVTLALLVLAVAAGVAFQVPNTANLRAYTAELLEQGVSGGFGEVRLRPVEGDLFDDGDAVAARAAATPGVLATASFLGVPGALARGGASAVAPIFGFDPASPRRPFRVAEGAGLAPGDDAGALVGRALARRLGVNVGDVVELRVILAGEGATIGAASEDLLRDGCGLGLLDCAGLEASAGVVLRRFTLTVRGVVTGTFGAFESVFVERGFLAGAADRPRAASLVSVYSGDPRGAAALAGRLSADVVSADARTWMDDSPTLRSSVGSIEAVSAVSHGMAITAVVIPVWALLYINVLHRRREVGVLGALGFSRGEVFGAFLLQSLFTGLAGTLLGSAAGLGVIRWFQEHPLFEADGFVIRPALELAALVEPVAIVLLATVAAGVYPAWRAAGIDPARVLRGLS